MKTCLLSVVLAASSFLLGMSAYSETIHQTVRGEAASSPEGGSALSKKLIEIKEIPGSGKVARVVGTVNQWGYVNFWFGLPAPAGKAIVRFRIYVDEDETAAYAAYIKKDGGDPLVVRLQIPADAPKNSFVNIDLPVEASQEWSGLTLKKIVASGNPSPWIDSVSIVLP